MLTLSTWSDLNSTAQSALLRRPPAASADVSQCQAIIDQVRAEGDKALYDLTRRFDKVDLQQLRVDPADLTEALATLDKPLGEALQAAYQNIHGFHQQQIPAPCVYSPASGVQLEIQYRPVEAVGLYVPGGTAPLPSTVLMLGIPSLLSGCPVRVLCTPPQANGKVDPLVLAAAKLCGIDHVYAVGGAQAIAAMAYGTDTVPKVCKIFGPGNPWVTRAKQLVAQDVEGAGYDMPAGPSEVLVIADTQARADFVAADLLSQAEHGADSQVLLVTTCATLAKAVQEAVTTQLQTLSRASIARAALSHSHIILAESVEQAISISNQYAPEHLILNIANARASLHQVTNAGSVFVGQWTPESVGDYSSGTNHVLPTHGYARYVSGVSVTDFQKRISVQELSPEGLHSIGWIAAALADAEGLDAHAEAVRLRERVSRSLI